eukprot:g6981.t1
MFREFVSSLWRGAGSARVVVPRGPAGLALNHRTKERPVALLVDGDHAMPSQLEHILAKFHERKFHVPVRRAYFGRADIAGGRKWTQFQEKQTPGEKFDLIVVKRWGTSGAELVDKKLSIDAIRLGLMPCSTPTTSNSSYHGPYHVAVMSRDKGFAEVFAELERCESAPRPFFAVSDVGTKVFFEKFAILVAQRRQT